ncbi:MAG: type II toxin-antitoxin system MqsA family antitoxin [Oceanococcus sp.]|nr:MAG: type II toxin-antitoxin system MqsA family antitoxin [Oceanococcus sp.]
MVDTSYCPVCDAENALVESVYSDHFEYKGKKLRVDGLESYECSECGATPIVPDQARRNQLRIVDAKRRVDGLLTGEEIVAVRERMGLTQAQAALVFGGGANAFSKYERGDVVQSAAMNTLLLMASELPGADSWLRARAGFEPQEIESAEYSQSHGNVINLRSWRGGAAKSGFASRFDEANDGEYHELQM